jgi:sigma-B regulation protein RsbU (phosphoserine phosphatase)
MALYRTQMIGTLVLLTIALGLALVAANSITRPLREIVTATEKVAEGDLDIELPFSGRNDEIGALSRAFERMAVDLKKYIRDLTEITGAKERMESELEIAAGIQRSMLPSSFPAYPDRDDFDIYAIMEPAKEVGGDLYDFFLIDDNHLCIAVGDVSDKGVPAALFMAVTIFLIQAAAAKGRGPEEIMAILNDQVCKGNDNCFFVTLFCGILDLGTGEFRFSNAGHEPPLLIRSGQEPVDIEAQRAPALGFLPGFKYQSQSLFLQERAMILAYTDGITEALNNDGQMYTKERLEATIGSGRWKDPKSLVEAVFQDLDEHVEAAPRSDDLTLLAVNFPRG